MKCLILAAGYATRLYPLTENFPKPLMMVGEKNILEWLIDDIDSSGEVDDSALPLGEPGAGPEASSIYGKSPSDFFQDLCLL